MDLEGIYAAGTIQSVREIDADGEGKASSSSGEGRPSAGPDSLDICGRSRNSRACAHVIPQVLAYACFT